MLHRPYTLHYHFWIAYFCPRFGNDFAAYPRVRAWYRAVNGREAVQRGLSVMRDAARAAQEVREKGGMSTGQLTLLFKQKGMSKL